MATTLKLRRGTTTQHATFTGALGEVTVDTDKDVIVVHDGSTAGGFPAIRAGGALGTPSSGTVTNLTGTASININGTVGATTPAAGTFTSLSDSGNLTFTGTGNRITGDFNNATIANRLMFQGSVVNGGTVVTAIPNGTSASCQLVAANASDPTNAQIAQVLVSATEASFRSAAYGTGTGTYLPMTFYTGGSERMRIDTSGNVGIGTTTFTYTPKLQINGANVTVAGRYGVQNIMSTDAFAIDKGGSLAFGGKYATDGSYEIFGQISGRKESAGDGAYSGYLAFATGVTMAERMRIDSSGNVGIGKTPVSAMLDVNGTVKAGNGTATAPSYSFQGSSAIGMYTPDAGFSVAFTTGNSERMRIDSSGNVGIGTSSPVAGARLAVIGGGIQLSGGTTAQEGIRIQRASGYASITGINNDNNAFNPITFFTSGTEAARIDTSGNLLVGTTSSGGVGFTVGADAAGRILTSNVSAVPFDVYLFKNNGTTVGKITVNTASTAYTTTSDYRLKENISPISGALDVVSQLKPVNYTWKLSGEATQGFIAHELQAVVPDCVVGEKDAVDAEGNPVYQGVDTSFLVVTLTAAIQELKAINDAQAEIITALTARITALESN